MSNKGPEYEVEIKVPIYPTEDTYKLLACLSNLFPEAEWEVGKESVQGYTTSLKKFAELLRDQQIRDTAEDYLTRHIHEDRCEFVLSKQASCCSKVNFTDQKQPLGGIDVKLTSDYIEEVIEGLTSKGDSRC